MADLDKIQIGENEYGFEDKTARQRIEELESNAETLGTNVNNLSSEVEEVKSNVNNLSSEQWTFTLEDGTTVTKNIVVQTVVE